MSDFEDSNSFMDEDLDEDLFPRPVYSDDLSDLSLDEYEEEKSERSQQNQNDHTDNMPEVVEEPVQTEKGADKKGKKQIIYNYEELKELQKVKKIALKPKWNMHFSRNRICTEIPDLKERLKLKKTDLPGVTNILDPIPSRSSKWAQKRDKKIFSKSRQQFIKRNQAYGFGSKIL